MNKVIIIAFICVGLCVGTLIAKVTPPAEIPDGSKLGKIDVERDYVKDKAATIGATVGSICTLDAIINGANDSPEVTARKMVSCYKINFTSFGYNFEPDVYDETLTTLYTTKFRYKE